MIEDDGDSALLVWNVTGSSVVTEGGDPAEYTVSYTGATLAPGQTMTISVATNVGFDPTLNDAESGTDYTALGTVLTFTGGLSGAGSSYDVVTVNTTAPIAMQCVACNGLWNAFAAIPIAGTVTNITGTVG